MEVMEERGHRDDDDCLDQELRCFPCEEGSDPADVVESKSAGSGSSW